MGTKDKIKQLEQIIQQAEQELRTLKTSVGMEEDEQGDNVSPSQGPVQTPDQQRIVEGYFDGQNMIANDNKAYPVPANYASKSKMVEGDLLKLTITEDGSFIYKQIGPIERKKIIGTLKKYDNDFYVECGDDRYRVLLASVTYFKGEEGDEATIIIPKHKKSDWAAVEYIIKNTEPEKKSAPDLDKVREYASEDSVDDDDYGLNLDFEDSNKNQGGAN